MGASAIEWTQQTWNPVTGCTKISPGCAHCYAETLTRRFASTWGASRLAWTPANASDVVRLHPARLGAPLSWRTPRMVFVNSMSDLFHELVPFEFIDRVFAVMACAQGHTFQVLTKRPERMLAYLSNDDCQLDGAQWPLPNLWLGVSIENRRFTWRAEVLRATPAAVRFVSAEPLLGPLVCEAGDAPQLDLSDIDWLIVGGESGPGHRPMALSWARDLRDLAAQSGSALFVKQLGGPRPGAKLSDLPPDLRIRQMPRAAARSAA